MSNVERLESHMVQLGLRYDEVQEDTWVLHPDTALGAPIACKLQDPIVLLTVPLFIVSPTETDREGLFRRLLELNSELLHSSYGLEGEQVILSAAHPVETLDFLEFQAIIDDMSMALDNHSGELLPWVTGRAAANEGNV
jgi:hypothetical protein